ncbi:HNH endonuclease [Nocardia sp. CC227C]|uniref:HNH endonuclease n=1 Tax=Nocardia sp. CC227C TaxID=3044562 RepID=UPI00278BC88B|nr:HNH endonuclease [Nocardia sp. CC227C]
MNPSPSLDRIEHRHRYHSHGHPAEIGESVANGEFSSATKALVAARAGYMCTNPDCNRLVVGPEVTGLLDETEEYLSTNIGEFAHISGRRLNSARYDETLTDEQRASPDNALLLCRVCHKLIDSNGGPGYSAELLRSWKTAHTRQVRELLTSRRKSVLTKLLSQTQNADVVQHVFELLANKRSLHEYPDLETWWQVRKAFGQLRDEVTASLKDVQDDDRLKQELRRITSAARKFMAEVQVEDFRAPETEPAEAEVLLAITRTKIMKTVAMLSERYEIPVPPELQSQVWKLTASRSYG